MTIKASLTKYYLEIVALLVLLLLLPLTLKVNFIQNDDWNRTLTTYQFIKGNFTLLPETANTFYLQGILGMLFYFITGSMHFPILTLIFSILNFYIFGLIIKRHVTQNISSVILLTLLFFLNPFHIYSIWGFMAENFYLFFTLFSLLLFFEFQKKETFKLLFISNILVILGFFVKQVSIVTGLAYLAYFTLARKWKALTAQVVMTLLTILYYYFLFPRTQEMHIKNVTFGKLADISFITSLTWANIVYSAAFTVPLILVALKSISKIKVILVALTCISIYLLLWKYFNPNSIGVGEFPFIQNTFTRTGFYPLNLHGTPYTHKAIFDIFTTWQMMGTIGAYLLISLYVTHIKKLNTPTFYFYTGYLLLMLLITEMFDRYLLPIFPVLILLILRVIGTYKKSYNVILLPFILFLLYINYQFSMDFVIGNNLMFNKAKDISNRQNLEYSQLLVNSAWRKVYSGRPKVYRFSYDGPDSTELLQKGYTQSEVLRVDYPFNTHIYPYIYIYENKTNLSE